MTGRSKLLTPESIRKALKDIYGDDELPHYIDRSNMIVGMAAAAFLHELDSQPPKE